MLTVKQTITKAVIFITHLEYKCYINFENMIRSKCDGNNIDIVKVITVRDCHDIDALHELASTIKQQQQPIAIITNVYSTLKTSDILIYTTLATLAGSGLVHIFSCSFNGEITCITDGKKDLFSIADKFFRNISDTVFENSNTRKASDINMLYLTKMEITPQVRHNIRRKIYKPQYRPKINYWCF